MSLPIIFKPKKKFKLIRLGRNYDGGYLIGENSLQNTKTLISFGINDDWSFEKDFVKKNSSIKVICFDDKPLLKFLLKNLIINLIFFLSHFKFKKISNLIIKIFGYLQIRKRIDFKKKKISYGDLDKILSKLKDKDNIFIKIDIEGFEYRVLDEIIKNQKKLIGIIVEFHDIDYHKDLVINFINSLDLKLIHTHPNNASVIDKNGDPTILEMTFERKEIILSDVNILPHELDMVNDPEKKDVILRFR